MGIFDNMFFPPRKLNEFNTERYIKDLENGEFSNLFNLGVSEGGGGRWLLQNFVESPHALFAGATGSGKSEAACYTLLTYLLANSENTIMFIADASKSASNYSELFGYEQVYKITSDGGRPVQTLIERTIDLVHSETVARKDLFKDFNNINEYEASTGKKMARIVLVLEESHAIFYPMLDFDKQYVQPHSPAGKLFALMRTGRSYGINIIAISQKSTKSDIPTQISSNFINKMIFKVSAAEASYIFGNADPARLGSAQKGRCFTEFGQVQFPWIQKESQRILLKRYMKPLTAECAYLNPQLIHDFLDGKSPKELYRLKKVTELAEAMESYDGELVLEILHEKMGNQVDRIDSRTDNYGVCMVVTFKTGERRAVMYKPDAKLSHKTINNLAAGIRYHKCNSALLFCLGEHLAPSVYRAAKDLAIKVYDHEDIKLIARQIDAGKTVEALRLEDDLGNTDSIPDYVSEGDVKRAKDPFGGMIYDGPEIELPKIDGRVIKPKKLKPLNEPSFVDPDDLNLALLGEDPAILKALKSSKKRKAQTKDDDDKPSED